jgi:hypothetical protein
MQLVVQPFGVESDCSAIVAEPLLAPALAVLSPAIRLVLLADPASS